MITGELKSKIDAIWNAFWSGGIANPLEVIEQITFLLFIRRLDVNRPGMSGDSGVSRVWWSRLTGF
ncbi:MAG: type I restriction-modification system subunit M N-terminal domain-containing protein [Nocardioides sp.]